jgi:hypothetical protein
MPYRSAITETMAKAKIRKPFFKSIVHPLKPSDKRCAYQIQCSAALKQFLCVPKTSSCVYRKPHPHLIG